MSCFYFASEACSELADEVASSTKR